MFSAESYPLPVGTVLTEGTITSVTLTAYEVVSAAGTVYVPFMRVHERRRVEPLVRLG